MTASATTHLRPHAEVAERVLLPGDPGRALRLAQQLIDTPRMLNHNRGLWGYTGPAEDGRALTIQSTGMGGPSAAIVAEGALAEDGASRALGASGTVRPEPALQEALRAAADGAASGLLVSADLFYDPDPDRPGRWAAAGALAVEMEAATLFTVAARHGAAAACVCAVSDIVATQEHIGDAALERAEVALGRVGVRALG